VSGKVLTDQDMRARSSIGRGYLGFAEQFIKHRRTKGSLKDLNELSEFDHITAKVLEELVKIHSPLFQTDSKCVSLAAHATDGHDGIQS